MVGVGVVVVGVSLGAIPTTEETDDRDDVDMEVAGVVVEVTDVDILDENVVDGVGVISMGTVEMVEEFGGQ